MPLEPDFRRPGLGRVRARLRSWEGGCWRCKVATWRNRSRIKYGTTITLDKTCQFGYTLQHTAGVEAAKTFSLPTPHHAAGGSDGTTIP